MYNILRWLVIIIILMILFILFRKRMNRITIIISAIVVFVVYLIINIVPIERKYMEFDSVEDVVKYQYKIKLDRGPIHIIEDEESAIVIFKEETMPYLFEKENGKWKMNNDRVKNNIKWLNPKNGYTIITVESEIDNKKYVLLLNMFYEDELQTQNISDNYGSEFKIIKEESIIDKKKYQIIFYTVIDNDISDYTLYINNEKFKLQDISEI